MRILFFDVEKEKETGFHVMINDKEVTNPVAKVLVALLGIIIALFAVGVVLLIIIPITGIVITSALGIAILIGLVALVFSPFLLIAKLTGKNDIQI